MSGSVMLLWNLKSTDSSIHFLQDRLNRPTSFGYTDLLMNVRLQGGNHVGELQLHLEPIVAIKPLCHRGKPRASLVKPRICLNIKNLP